MIRNVGLENDASTHQVNLQQQKVGILFTVMWSVVIQDI